MRVCVQSLLVSFGVALTPVPTPEAEKKKREAEEAAMLALLEGDAGGAASTATEVRDVTACLAPP